MSERQGLSRRRLLALGVVAAATAVFLFPEGAGLASEVLTSTPVPPATREPRRGPKVRRERALCIGHRVSEEGECEEVLAPCSLVPKAGEDVSQFPLKPGLCPTPSR